MLQSIVLDSVTPPRLLSTQLLVNELVSCLAEADLFLNAAAFVLLFAQALEDLFTSLNEANNATKSGPCLPKSHFVGSQVTKDASKFKGR